MAAAVLEKRGARPEKISKRRRAGSAAAIMEILTLISLDILFLILLFLGFSFERRLLRCEKEHAHSARKAETRIISVFDEINRLKERIDDLTLLYDSGLGAEREDQVKAQTAEKRFTEGIASILGYEYGVKGAK